MQARIDRPYKSGIKAVFNPHLDNFKVDKVNRKA